MDAFGDRRILVVGGAGFVGGNLVRALLELEPERIWVVDNFLSAERWNVPTNKRITLIQGSIADDNVLSALPTDLDYVFHLATFHGNQNSIHDPLADHANNTFTTLKLYESLKEQTQLRKIVYTSAGCTVAPKTHGLAVPTSEDSPVSLELDSPYQISKIVGEFYSNYYWKQHSLPVVKARFQNVYGPGEILGAGQWRGTPATVWRNVIPTFIYRALRCMPLCLEGGGATSRDFIYVDDIVNGLLLCAERGNPGEVYNLASGAETTIRELAELILGHAAPGSKIEAVPGRTWDNSGKRLGCARKSQQELGFTARMPLPEGLFRTMRWMDEHLAMIESCMARHATNIARHDFDRRQSAQQTSGRIMHTTALRENRSIQPAG